MVPYNPVDSLATFMSARIPKTVREALAERRATDALRALVPVEGVDLCSNDYLGISRELAKLVPCLAAVRVEGVLGATGSRLVSGTTARHEEIESLLAKFHQSEAALLLGSGYEANLGLLGSLGSRHCTILYDELVHASMRDGIRLSSARSYSFRHNDLDDLSKKMAQARGDCFIAVESVYSMDGDCAPLVELCELCERHGAHLVVDEAHGTGVFGAKGEGLVQSLGLQARVFARVHTFGKAVGYRGAVIVGTHQLREYLVNFARPFIYSTAFDLVSLWYVETAYTLMINAVTQRAALAELIAAYHSLAGEFSSLETLQTSSPIQAVIVPTNRAVVGVERALAQEGIFAKAIRSPTVPAGRERIRLCLHSFNTQDDLRRVFDVLSRAVRSEVAHG